MKLPFWFHEIALFIHGPRLMFAAAVLMLPSSAFAAERPNIVIILADDLGYGSVGCYGANPKLVRTPHIDRLAAEGIRFTDGNSPSSVCTPTRYALLTGRYCWRSRLEYEVTGVFDPLLIENGRPTLASILQARGYHTAAIGKWHLGYGNAQRANSTEPLVPGPLEIGFGHHFGVPQNNGDLTGVFVEDRAVLGLRSRTITPTARRTHYGPAYLGLDAPERDEPEVMSVLGDRAEAWLGRVPSGEPFFLYLAPTAVHEPVWPSAAVAGTSAAGPFGDFIHDLDRLVGRVLAALERKGVTRETLVLFTSDNGGVIAVDSVKNPSIRAAQDAGLRMNGPWRGRKHSIYEGGFRVPFIVRWPSRTPAGIVSPTMVNVVDVFATVADLLKIPIDPNGGGEDSISFAPQLTGQISRPSRDSMILHSAKGNFALRHGAWKYIEGKPHSRVPVAKMNATAGEYQPQLFDIERDPAEARDLITEHPEVARRLQQMLDQHRREPATAPLAVAPP